MTAEQIRSIRADDRENKIVLLREIAAQLAELNATLKGISGMMTNAR